MNPDALSLLPPMVAIILAVWWRNVLPALFVGVWVGTTLLEQGRPDLGLLRILDTLLFNVIASPASDGSVDYSHLTIILFTLFLGAMIGVMSDSGGSAAVVNHIAKRIKTRHQGQTLTWLTGLVVFFDDYANTILIGGTMRPVTDRLKISREKLAFLIDATAAPVAGLAVISTWAGFEVGLIEEGFQGVGQEVDGWRMFIETIPYRFYPVTMLLFVAAIAWTGRDYGPMFQAETDAVNAVPEEEVTEENPSGQRPFMRHAFIPLIVLVGIVAVGITIDLDSSSKALLIASFIASIAGLVSTLVTRTFSLEQAVEAWVGGVKSMIPACVILVMAWMIGTVCDAEHLDTAGFLSSTIGKQLDPAWLPSVSFLMAAGVSFATGSSWATMTLLIPLFTSLSWNLLGADVVEASHPIVLGTIGSVLAGSIFGDHCSPISDTTVLSSAASHCDHLKHVSTQLPYAVTVGGISLLLGCVPIGFGLNVWICLLIQCVTLLAVIFVFGRPPGAGERQLMPKTPGNPIVVIEPTE
ncbi:MAG: Na+/H+ antiporter NhaC family protein [Planctomycetaceae bacterium]|nr:Na+/H+ antiporter NhaC family protein [Planctomycetaceae bacterium]